MDLEIEIRRSSRKTAAIEVCNDGCVIIRVPYRMPRAEIERLLKERAGWIAKHLVLAGKRQKEAAAAVPFTEAELKEIRQRAALVISERVSYYAPLIGVSYGRVSIKLQKTRWGSCSAKGNLNFNALLVLMPLSVLDYVVVHELAHRRELNHSPRFWAIVRSVLPDYAERRKWLRENGRKYMQRIRG